MPATFVNTHNRFLIRRDLPEVLAIDAAHFVDPWRGEDLVRFLRLATNVGVVAEYDDTVAGYLLYRMLDRRIEIARFAVAPRFLRHGVGRQLIHRVASKLSAQRRTTASALIPDSDLPAQLFLRSCGFRCQGVLRNEFDSELSGPHDGYLFTLDALQL